MHLAFPAQPVVREGGILQVRCFLNLIYLISTDPALAELPMPTAMLVELMFTPSLKMVPLISDFSTFTALILALPRTPTSTLVLVEVEAWLKISLCSTLLAPVEVGFAGPSIKASTGGALAGPPAPAARIASHTSNPIILFCFLIERPLYPDRTSCTFSLVFRWESALIAKRTGRSPRPKILRGVPDYPNRLYYLQRSLLSRKPKI